MKPHLANLSLRISLILLLSAGIFAIGTAVFAAMDYRTDMPLVMKHFLQSTPGTWWKPSPGTSWQWQLSGAIDTTLDVQMYDIDLFDASQEVIDQLHRDGRVVICYFSAGTYEDWRPDRGAFPTEVLGKPMPDWPAERWLDISRIDLLENVMSARLDLAVQKNCDGVEADN